MKLSFANTANCTSVKLSHGDKPLIFYFLVHKLQCWAFLQHAIYQSLLHKIDTYSIKVENPEESVIWMEKKRAPKFMH